MFKKIKTIGVTNQRETSLCWDKITGLPLHNAIVWHDIRNRELVEKMIEKNNGNPDAIREKCGLPINSYFSALKIRWIIENCEEVKNRFKNKIYV